MRKRGLMLLLPLVLGFTAYTPAGKSDKEKLYLEDINVSPPPIAQDKSVKYDFDIVYVRALRLGDKERTLWTEVEHPALTDAGADLMLLHPDGSEEVLVKGGQDGSITDPFVSFDAQSVYYSHIQGLKGTVKYGQQPFEGADIFKIHVKSRKITRLTDQAFTPNTGAGDWSKDFRKAENGKNYLGYGVLNLGPCPLPGGKIVFTSNRNAFLPPKHASSCQQLFVMDEDGQNVECIGHLNLGMALHPVVLVDGRIMFSSLESQGMRNAALWGLWTIHPDGTNWAPMLSAFDPGIPPNSYHFQTQLSDESIVVESYYHGNNSGFGTYFKFPPGPKAGYPAFGPAYLADPRNAPVRLGRHHGGVPRLFRLPFSPFGIESLTRFAHGTDGPAESASLTKKDAPAVGKVTHPSGAPDNHLLTVWSPGPANHQYTFYPMIDGGIYLIKSGKAIDEPGQMLLIKNDPKYNEQWPRALVPYKRIYGVDEPRRLAPLANDGKLSTHLPEGTPYGLVGTSSLYKRESYPNGSVPKGKVTAQYAFKKEALDYQGLDPSNTTENGASLNWFNQGADAGLYSNDDIHAIRILALEPTTDRNRGPKTGRLFLSHAQERMRILGEIPVRHFNKGKQPLDPDGNPDTSFLAKIPADVAFTFQTLDKDGMVLNMAQTWHQLRPGEVRNNCGGCHAHSQQPTLFEKTASARSDYAVFDLTTKTPLLTTKKKDESGKQWDLQDETGLRYEKSVKNVEYFRDVKPILDRSCVACHTHKVQNPPAKLVLDDDKEILIPHIASVPGTYYRLAWDDGAKYGHKPIIGTWRGTNASRYIRCFQSRRSLLIWKILGRRTDGWTNDDFPTETVPGDASTLHWKGKPLANTPANRNFADLDFDGKVMPPPEAVAGTAIGPNGNKVKVAPLSDEDKRTLICWIDLGCPIDLDYDPQNSKTRGFGWMLDDQRPTLTLTTPRAGANKSLDRILVGMHDYDTGLDLQSFEVVADFAVNGIAAGKNLASKFQPKTQGVWELKLSTSLTSLARGKLTVAVKDRQGNVTRIERTFSIGAASDHRSSAK
jgi:hypothetical protein